MMCGGSKRALDKFRAAALPAASGEEKRRGESTFRFCLSHCPLAPGAPQVDVLGVEEGGTDPVYAAARPYLRPYLIDDHRPPLNDRKMAQYQVVLVVALIRGDHGVTDAQVYRVVARPSVDVVDAIRAAAREFVETPGGREYREMIGYDGFNWGDAVVAIPAETLARHGILFFDVLEEGQVVVVDHDEHIA